MGCAASKLSSLQLRAWQGWKKSAPSETGLPLACLERKSLARSRELLLPPAYAQQAASVPLGASSAGPPHCTSPHSSWLQLARVADEICELRLWQGSSGGDTLSTSETRHLHGADVQTATLGHKPQFFVLAQTTWSRVGRPSSATPSPLPKEPVYLWDPPQACVWHNTQLVPSFFCCRSSAAGKGEGPGGVF